MEIKKTDTSFYIGELEHPDGILEFAPREDGVVEAYHTYVKPEFRSQAYAGKLYDAFIEYVKENNLKVIPSCSYIDKKMSMQEYQDYRCK